MYSTYDEEYPNRIRPTRRRSWCWAVAPIALARALNSIIAAYTPRWRCAKTVTLKTIMVNCNPETVSTDYDTSDRLYFRNPLTLKTCWKSSSSRKTTWRDRAIRRPNSPEAATRPGSERRRHCPIVGTSPDMIDAAEDRERFQKLLHEQTSAPTAEPHGHVPSLTRWNWRRKSATRWSCVRPMCWAAARWKSCTTSAIWSATCAKPSRYRTIRRSCWIVSSTMRSKSTLIVCSTVSVPSSAA